MSKWLWIAYAATTVPSAIFSGSPLSSAPLFLWYALRAMRRFSVICQRTRSTPLHDPIPTSDYYSLASVFLNTVYKEYPLAPKKVVDDYKAQDKKIENKEKLLEDFTKTESTQLAQTLALQASKYMVAAWRVTGEPKEDVPKVADAAKLDYELFDRWLKFLAKPPRFYPYLTAWQTMIKSGGTKSEAQKLADEFQALILEVMFERKEVNEENDIIKAKALPGTKKKEPGKLPSDFVTNDDFCPVCGG